MPVDATSGEKHRRSEAEPGGDDRQRVLGMEPLQCGDDISGFSNAIMFAFAKAGTAEIEAERGELESPLRRVENFHRVVDHLVVHGPATERMGMASTS